MKDFVIKYWVQVLFGLVMGGLGTALKVLEKRMRKQTCDYKALKEGTQALLRSEIIRCYDVYMERGYISIHGLESVSSMYEAYHTLGGNGTVTKLMEELRELPVKTRKIEK
ncbi:hypothetical protein EHE19_019125 [Ruminiclostridium herbifermentans]|uniref:Uncharacterized protein n=1 Tax=Ruminiclostridium herbifermentans TaxID=2488810 RepID=A0A4U7JBX9_9FIRM|nr:hypothetical protein [Ruminiclostridium herbifermentans]QNU66910.1 hypothetical protein EHE19_019125 [Ruminiclostridium herbifermentans]